MEGAEKKKIVEGVDNKVLKPVQKKVLNNSARALETGMQLGTAAASKNPGAIINAETQAGEVGVTGKSIKCGTFQNFKDESIGKSLRLKVM